MKNSHTVIATAISSIMAFAAITASGTVFAADKANVEKCYGIAKAAKNDCKTSTHACAGTAAKDGQGDAFVLVPKGTCDKIVGGSTKMEKSAM